jgi:hypothetical protein
MIVTIAHAHCYLHKSALFDVRTVITPSNLLVRAPWLFRLGILSLLPALDYLGNIAQKAWNVD